MNNLYTRTTRAVAWSIVPAAVVVAGLCYAAFRPITAAVRQLEVLPVTASIAAAVPPASEEVPRVIEVPTVVIRGSLRKAEAPRPKAVEEPKKEYVCGIWHESAMGGAYQTCEWR